MPVVLENRSVVDKAHLRQAILRHVTYSLGTSLENLSPREMFRAVALAVRDPIIDNLLATQQRYQQAAHGIVEINWGNVILIALIVVLLMGGGGFVYWNERRLRGSAKPLPVSQPAAAPIEVAAYPAEVVALLPSIARLNPIGLRALKRLLENPGEASDLLNSLSRLDPELVRRIRMLDRDSRALLMGLAGD